MNFKPYDLLLSYLRNDYVDRIFSALENEMEACDRNINRSKQSGCDEYLEAVVDDECGMAEELIGIAFVVAQVQISEVISNIKKLHGFAQKETPVVTLKTTTGVKEQILQFGDALFKDSYGISKIKVVNAMADYYKHKGEPQLDAKTSSALKAIGCKDICIKDCESISSGNFRHAMKILGIEFNSIGKLTKILQEWQDKLYTSYRDELTSVGLI